MALSSPEINELANLLDKRYERLRAEVREETEQGDAFADALEATSGDSADHSVAHALADLDATFIDRHVVEMRDIEAARLRIEDGTFGICVGCGAGLGIGRLRAYPAAKRCVACQQQWEDAYPRDKMPSL